MRFLNSISYSMPLLNVCDANLQVMKTKYDHRPCDKLGKKGMVCWKSTKGLASLSYWGHHSCSFGWWYRRTLAIHHDTTRGLIRLCSLFLRKHPSEGQQIYPDTWWALCQFLFGLAPPSWKHMGCFHQSSLSSVSTSASCETIYCKLLQFVPCTIFYFSI